jgi:lipoate-protein ligase A
MIKVPTILSPSSQKKIPGHCFVGAEKFDVLWHGRKIAGAAQRRTRTGLLIQGSIQPPPIPLLREDWQAALREVARRQWAVEWHALEISGQLAKTAANLQAAKYSHAAYHQKR